MKFVAQPISVDMKVRSEIVHNCPKCCINFVDKAFRFSRMPKTFKPPVVYDYEWYHHEPKIIKARLYDPLGVIDCDRLNRP